MLRHGSRGWLMALLGALFFMGMSPATTLLSAADSEQAEHLYREGNTLYDQGKFAAAVSDYDQCLAQDPKYAAAIFNRALADEMVDRTKALADWKRFIEVAGDDEQLKWNVGQARARIEILGRLAAAPGGLQSSHYVPEAGDYYASIGLGSEGTQWRTYPVKVFLGSAPDIRWQQGTREAFDVWKALFPMELVATSPEADIRIAWHESTEEPGNIGEESDWVQLKHVGDQLTSRQVAVISVDLSRRWSKDEMRAIMLHEFGHALGIKGHSDSKKDIMYFEMQEKYHRAPVPTITFPIYWKSLPKQPSQRDINTLIRLYNSAGYITRLN